MGPSLPCPAQIFRKESLGQRDPDTQQGLTHNTVSWMDPSTLKGCRLGVPSTPSLHTGSLIMPADHCQIPKAQNSIRHKQASKKDRMKPSGALPPSQGRSC